MNILGAYPWSICQTSFLIDLQFCSSTGPYLTQTLRLRERSLAHKVKMDQGKLIMVILPLARKWLRNGNDVPQCCKWYLSCWNHLEKFFLLFEWWWWKVNLAHPYWMKAKNPVASLAAGRHFVTLRGVSLRTEPKHWRRMELRELQENRARALIILYLKPEYV